MKEFNELFEKIGTYFSQNGWNLLASLCLLIIGLFFIKLLSKIALKIVYATKIDNAVGGFFVSLVKFFLWIILFFIIASIMGISGNSFLVAFSSVALAIGLALKDSLANIANGIVIIMTKPFKKGDHVSINGVEGLIRNIKILTTEIYTFDNKKVVVPNSTIVSSAVYNYTANPTRRIDLTFGVAYDSDMKLVKKVLVDSLVNLKGVISTPAPVIFMKEHNASSVDWCVRIWVNTSEYWKMYGDINETVFEAFKENSIEIPYPQVDVHFRNNLEMGEKNEKN